MRWVFTRNSPFLSVPLCPPRPVLCMCSDCVQVEDAVTEVARRAKAAVEGLRCEHDACCMLSDCLDKIFNKKLTASPKRA